MEATEICPLTKATIAELLQGREADLAEYASDERRRSPRWPFPGTVEVWIPQENGEERYLLATCENLGRGGVGVRCDEELPVDWELPIAIHQPERSLHGRAIVRHATWTPKGYYVGMEFVFEHE